MNEWPSSDVAELAGWIAVRTGLTFSPARRGPAAATLEKALRTSGASGAAALRERLEGSSTALDELLAELTVGETYFFRQPAHFDLIRSELFPGIEPRPPRPLRLWSAGCASGEEAYSLAILAGECGRTAHVVGTDLSRARLAVARRGRYGAWSLRGVATETIERYFRADGSSYELQAEVRTAVDFRYLNLVEDRYPALSAGIWGMDVILCRNVLIYLDRESVRVVARKLVDSLSDEGWLLLGGSDPLISDLAPVEVVVTPAGLAYRRRPVGQAALNTTARIAAPIELVPLPPRPATRPVPEIPGRDLRGDLLRIRELADQGRLAEAGRLCAAALDQHRDSAELLYLHGLLLLAGGQPQAAAEAGRRSLYLDRGLVVTHLLMGDALLRAGDPPGARRSLRRAGALLAKLPADAEVPAADGEPAGRLLRMVETRLGLLQQRIDE